MLRAHVMRTVTTSIDPAIDFSLCFMPERLTPLYSTPLYSTLTRAQRLRYNQLQALYLNEQILFFERSLTPVLTHFLKSDLPPKLRRNVEEFAADEERHSAMFRRLNRLCAPDRYANSDFHFIRMPAMARRLTHSMARRPRLFPLTLWLMHIQEERALFLARQFLKCEHAIEPNFLEIQRIHLADEVSHVKTDKQLLDLIWPKTNRLLIYLNVRLLSWLLREYFGPPRRAQLNVVSALALEFPDLQPRLPELHRALIDLRYDRGFLQRMYSRENVPDLFERFDRCPELHSLARVLPGYQPKPAA
jgi:hypothetical protein